MPVAFGFGISSKFFKICEMLHNVFDLHIEPNLFQGLHNTINEVTPE
jgi:hypothetical protein